jgi:CheY-like chemotaxis protein
MDVPRTTVLLVDRRAGLDALAALFEAHGYELVSATSGQEALDHLERREFAVILLDLQVPATDVVREFCVK